MIFELSIDESWSDFLQLSKLENQELGGGICYKMVQDVTRWCKIVQDGEIWWNMVEYGARWCKMMTRGVVPVQRRVRAAAYPPLPPPPRLLLAHNQILRLWESARAAPESERIGRTEAIKTKTTKTTKTKTTKNTKTKTITITVETIKIIMIARKRGNYKYKRKMFKPPPPSI